MLFFYMRDWLYDVLGKRYRPGGSSRGGGYGGGSSYGSSGSSYGSNGRSSSSGSGRYDSKPRSGAYNAQSDNINAMFAQAYQQVAASASGGASGAPAAAAGGPGSGTFTGYQFQ